PVAKSGLELFRPEHARRFHRVRRRELPGEARAPACLVEGALVRKPELQRPHGALAELPVQALEEDCPRCVELVAPAVILHQEVERAAGEHGRLCPRGDLPADGALPDLGRHAPRQTPRHPVLLQRAPPAASALLTAPARATSGPRATPRRCGGARAPPARARARCRPAPAGAVSPAQLRAGRVPRAGASAALSRAWRASCCTSL